MRYRLSLILFLTASALLLAAHGFWGWSLWWLLLPLLLFTGLAVYGSIRIEANFYLPSLNRLPDAAGRTLCLTFDDGPDPEVTPRILDILKAKGVKAVFFVIGKQIPGQEALLRRIAEEGHQVGNHSFSHHALFDLQPASAMAKEISRTNALITAVLHRPVTLFRPPYGVTNPMLAAAIRRTGMRSIGWNLRSFDTVARAPQELLARLLRLTVPGGIVLLHDRCPVTAAVLTDYIDEAHRQGYTFVTLNDPA